MRHDAIALSFEPHTEFFGEAVERHLLGNVWEYFRWRNYQQAIDIYAADVGFTYEYWFTPDAQIGDRAYLDICIVPPLAYQNHVGVIEEISRTIHWLYPHYSDRGAADGQRLPPSST